MKKRRIISILLIVCLISSLPGCKKKKEEGEKKPKDITIVCDYSLRPLVDDLVADYNLNNKASYKVEYMSMTEGISKLKDKAANLVIAFEGLKDEKLKSDPIASDGIAIIVNNQNNIDGISMDQLKDIYTGKRVLWKDLNSTMQNIEPIAYESTDDIQKIFEKKILSAPILELMTNSAYIVRDVNLAKDRVINYPNAIAFLPNLSASGSFKILKLNGVILNVESIKNNLYPFNSKICAYYSKESEDASKFIQYLKSDDGKKIIKKHCVDAS